MMILDLDAVGTSVQMLSHLDKFRKIFQDVLEKYRVIYIGYVFSLATFFATVYLGYFEVPWIHELFKTYYLEQLVFATMVFSVFMLVYFAWPYFGISLPRYWSAVVALTINGAAYFEEIFRAGIEAIDEGQREAARALGLSFPQTMFSVVLPQAIVVVLPPATSNSLELIKTTVLASVIALPELMKQAQQAHGFFANPTPLIAAALIFLAFLWPLVRLVGVLERKYKQA